MSRVEIEKTSLCGEITLPSSKSAAHRALICSFLAGGGSVSGIDKSNDIEATEKALAALLNGEDTIDCNESGSTLRFMIPVAAALGKSVTFIGRGKLPERPLGEYLRLLPEHSVFCESEGGLPLKISGQLTGGEFRIAGDISSQYITGLLFALPLLDTDSRIILTSPLQSRPYVDMTLDVLSEYGIEIEEEEREFFVRGNQKYKKTDYTVESDWSQAAFFLVGGALTGDITIKGLRSDSKQGDREIVNILKRFGADVMLKGDTVRVKKSALRGCRIDVKSIPDTVPALAVAASFADGKTEITGGERLRFKESDRIESVVTNLQKMGVRAQETADGMIIYGSEHKGCELGGYNDHRIVMAFCIAGLCADGKTVIDGAESVNKSYPKFFEDIKRLGGKVNVICNG